MGDTFRRVASRLCYSAVRSSAPDLLLQYGQTGVGIKGGREAATHLSCHLMKHHRKNPRMCLLKLEFSNGFNQCWRHTSFLDRVERDFLHGCSSAIYTQRSWDSAPTESSSGSNRGPLLFSLAWRNSLTSLLILSCRSWYLDDGTVIGPQSAVANFVHKSDRYLGPNHSLHLNPALSFPHFPKDFQCTSSGISLLGSRNTWSRPRDSTTNGMKMPLASSTDKACLISFSSAPL